MLLALWENSLIILRNFHHNQIISDLSSVSSAFCDSTHWYSVLAVFTLHTNFVKIYVSHMALALVLDM